MRRWIRIPKIAGLRQRWLVQVVGVVCALGMACVLAVTASFAVYYYSNLEANLHRLATETASFFANYLDQDYNEYYRSCITYAQTFEDRNVLELQFINAQGNLVVSSYGHWAGISPTTPEIAEAMRSRGVCAYVGQDPATGERIMAVSGPMIYSNGDVIGVLRYVTATRIMDHQVMQIGVLALAALLLLVTVTLLSSRYCLRSILLPLAEITDKAKAIANGGYGIQIASHYQDEIGDLAQTINDLSLKINQNEKMQAEFISSLSHELRTPLTAITGWSETLLRDERLDPQSQRGMTIILQETNRLTEMVVELLDFTRMQDGRVTLNVEPTDLRAVFEDTVFMYSSRLAQDGICLEYFDQEMPIPELPCDGKRLRQVFLNLLDNAAKHGGDGKRIEASIALQEADVVIQIRDYGPGIPEDELPMVKKKFYKGSSKSRGTGIGLAVCDEIVQLHGGSLELENAPDGGTLVTVRLPLEP